MTSKKYIAKCPRCGAAARGRENVFNRGLRFGYATYLCPSCGNSVEIPLKSLIEEYTIKEIDRDSFTNGPITNR